MRKADEPKQGLMSPQSPSKKFPPLGRSLSSTFRREAEKQTPIHEEQESETSSSSSSLSASKPFAALPSAAAAPLYDAAQSLVNTAERSIVKAITFVKKSTGAVSQPFPLAREAAQFQKDDFLGPYLERKPIPKTESDDSGATPSELVVMKATKSDGCPAEGQVVMGVLSKWINIGRGWGPRLFVLEGGVLSYYRLDGPDKVSVRGEVGKYLRPSLLGEEIKRCIQKEDKDVDKTRTPYIGGITKPLGSIHLLVANLRASRSDEKKFYVYSGTKTLDLRAETHEDRAQWMEILEAAKRRVDTTMREWDEMEGSRHAAAATVQEDAVTRLLQQLSSAGLPSEKVKELEDSLRHDVVGGLQQKLKEEQRRRWQLQKRIKDLETEKAQLETAVVDQTKSIQVQNTDQNAEEDVDDSASVPEEEEELRTGAHGDEDDDGEDNFFEAITDFMEHSGRMDPGALSQRLSMPRDMEKVGFDYPTVPRRTSLPEPAEAEKAVSLWEIIKDCVGKDVSRITLPVYFNEPISTLQKCAEEVEYSWLLDRAAEYGKQGDQLMRALHVAAFALSGYACTEGRVQKPFNPLMGETYEAEYPEKGWRFIAEKMQHNPNVVACHCEGKGWRFWGDCNMKIRFWGPSMQLDPLGVLSVEFDDGERYEWSKVTTGIYGLILGKLYIDHYGTMRVASNRNGMTVTLRFKERSIFDRNIHQVQGYAQDASGKKLATLVGKWDEHLHFVLGDPAASGSAEKALLKDAQLLWQANPRSTKSRKYKFTDWVVTLNEITPGLKEYLPPTDSRLRPDQRLLEEGHYEEANVEKLRLEQRQREARKSGEEGWHGRWFEQQGPHGTWTYTGKYWERRAAKDWSGVKDIFAAPQLNGSSQVQEAMP